MNAPSDFDILSGVSALKEMAAKPFNAATAIPKEAYTSDAFVALEMERVFAKEWICLGRAEQLAKPGDYIAHEIAGRPIFAIRDQKDRIRAFSNVCLHRMSTLLEGTGTVKNIVCPYHGWTYGLGGKLKAAAAMKRNCGFADAMKTGEYRLPRLRCEVWLGWIMVSLNPCARPVDEGLAALEAEIADFGPEAYRQSFHETFVWKTNWKILAENFMESYHLHVCHRDTIGGATDLSAMDCPPGAAGFNFHSIVKDPSAKLSVAHPRNKRLSGERRLTTYIITVYPSLLITISPGYFWYLSLHPKGSGEVHVTYAGGMAPEFADDPDAATLFAETKALLDAVNAEDKDCTERVYRGLSSDLAKPGHLSHLERPIYDFAGWLANRI